MFAEGKSRLIDVCGLKSQTAEKQILLFGSRSL